MSRIYFSPWLQNYLYSVNVYITDINSTELHTELLFIYNEVLLSSLHIKFTYTSYSYLLYLYITDTSSTSYSGLPWRPEDLVKNPPAIQETPVRFWVGKIHWRRNRLPTPVFLAGGFPHSSVICLQSRRPGFDSWLGPTIRIISRVEPTTLK